MLEAYARRMLAEMAADSSAHADAAAVLADAETFAASENSGDFASQSLVAMALKLSTSIDDIIWLSPFLVLCGTARQKAGFSLIYASLSILVVSVALVLARASQMGFDALMDPEDSSDRPGAYVYWTARRTLSVLAGVALAVNTVKEWERVSSEDASSDIEEPIDPDEPLLAENSHNDYRNSNRSNHYGNSSGVGSGPSLGSSVGMVRVGSRDSHSGTLGPAAAVGASVSPTSPHPLSLSLNNATISSGSSASTSSHPLPLSQQQQLPPNSPQPSTPNMGDAEWHRGARRLALIALCGTLDGMVVFAAFIIGSPITIPQLLAGTLAASAVVVLASWRLSLYRPFARLVEALPPWVVLALVSVFVLLRGLFRDLPPSYTALEPGR